MGKMKLYYDKKGQTLTVWFEDPKKEAYADEMGQDLVVMKDKKGKVLGFEKLNYKLPASKTSANKFSADVFVV